MTEEGLTENQAEIRMLELAESLALPVNTIKWVYAGVLVLSARKTARADGEAPDRISAEEVCLALLRDIRSTSQGKVSVVLSEMGIQSSKDIGRITYGLVGKELLVEHGDDTVEEFDDIFTEATLPDFLTRNGIKDEVFDSYKYYNQVMWLFYIVGTALGLALRS